MNRFKYNQKLMGNDRKIIEETDTYIKYEVNEDEKSVDDNRMREISCLITGRDMISKNTTYISNKIISKMEEIYGKEVSDFINDYFKDYVKYEVKTLIFKSNTPKSILKKKGFESLFNIENFHRRIVELLTSENPIMIEKINRTKFKVEKDLETYGNKLELYIKGVWL